MRAEVTGPGLSGKDAVRPVVIVEMLETVEDGLSASTERAAHSFGRTRNTTARLHASRRANVAAGRKLVEANGFGVTGLVELGLDLGAAIDLYGLDRRGISAWPFLGRRTRPRQWRGKTLNVPRDVDDPRIDLDQAAALWGFEIRRRVRRSGVWRTAFVDEMSTASDECNRISKGQASDSR